MKRILIALVVGAVLLSVLCVGVFFVLAFTPVRAQIENVIDRVAQRANLNFVPRVQSERSELQAPTGQSEVGILIAGVLPDSPAAEAGLRRGDILLEVNDQAVNSLPDVLQVLSSVDTGEAIILTVQRGDATETLTASADLQQGLPAQMLGIIPAVNGGMMHDFNFGPERGLQSHPGAQIVEVMNDSPAEAAGLQPEEWIVAANDRTVSDPNVLIELVQQAQPGDEIELIVENSDGETREVTVILAENPNEAQQGQAWLGVRLGAAVERQMPVLPSNPGSPMPVTPPVLPAGFENGAVVLDVTAGGPADQAGLQSGQIILAVNGDPITSSDQLRETITALEPGDELTLTVSGPDALEPEDVVVPLGENPDQAGVAYLGIRFAFLQTAPEAVPDGPVN